MPDVALRTTFIVGFPGETEADVEELLGFITAVGFDHVGVFTYSHEEDTSAFDLADDVPAAEKARRQRRGDGRPEAAGRAPGRRPASAPGPGWSSTARRPSTSGSLTGRLAGQAPEIDPQVFLTEADPPRSGPDSSSTSRSWAPAATT